MNTLIRVRDGRLEFVDTFRECYSPPEYGDVAILPGRVRPMTLWPLPKYQPPQDPWHDPLDI